MTAPPPVAPDFDDEPLDPELAALAGAILDGTPLDWSACASAGSASFAAELRIVADVASVHRSLPLADPIETAFPPGYPHSVGALTLTSSLGRGSFGEVFRAWDTQLHRDVALKLLFRRRQAADGAAALAEGRLLARVTHPNVVRVYGVEEIDDRVGLITEFIDGRTLAQQVAEEGPLSPREVTAIGVTLCHALGAVHAAGLLHRDIKAQNVMRDASGRIVLMDFGTGIPDAAGMEASAPAGTPLYLAPEVWRGEPATVRSDIYSLGVLLYYLTTGRFPVSGRTAAEISAAHAAGDATAATLADGSLPPAFARVLKGALAANRTARYANASAFERALVALEKPRVAKRAYVAALLMVAAIAAGAWEWRSRRQDAASAISPAGWVLVAPFENLTGEPALDGSIQYSVERELANSPVLQLLPQQRIDNVLTLLKKDAGSGMSSALAREVALRDGGVEAIVTGSVARRGSRYLITAGLVNPRSGDTRATVSAEAATALAIPLAVRDLCFQIRDRLGPAFTASRADRQTIESVTTPSLDALRSYARAVRLGDSGDWKQSLTLAQAAVKEDPKFAAAHLWLAWAERNTGTGPAAGLASARTAVELAPTVSQWEQHWIRGSYFNMSNEPAKAIAEYEALLKIRPDHIWGLRNLELLTRGTPRSIEHARRLAALLPNDPVANQVAAVALYNAEGATPEAERYRNRGADLLSAQTATTRPGEHAWLRLYPAQAAWMRGDMPRVEEEVRRVLAADEGQATTAQRLVEMGAFHLYLATGNVSEARAALSDRQPESVRALFATLADMACGDERSARARATTVNYRIEDVLVRSELLVWMMTRLGLTREARQLLDYFDAHPAPRLYHPAVADVARAHIALATGRLDDATLHARNAVAALPRAIHTDSLGASYRAAIALAEALDRRGDTEGAIVPLRGALESSRRGNPRANPGFFVLGVRARLAQLLRKAGRAAEAVDVEKAIDNQLSVADEACAPAIRRLWGIPAARGSGR